MNLEQLNQLNTDELLQTLATCCGSSVWGTSMILYQPYESTEMLHKISDAIWFELDDDDYLEAFTHHPMIGDLDALKDKFQDKFKETAAWASDEQQGSNSASEQTLLELQAANQNYLAQFGFIFIVCATGKSAKQMLQLLQARIDNDYAEELQIAADEQNKITHLRLKKLLDE